MARSVMRLGPVHVVVVVPSPSLRGAVVQWLRSNKRVRIVRAVASEAELGAPRVDCDLVVASALEGPRELHAIAKRFATRAGLVALTLGTTALPSGWVGARPGASQRWVLDQAIPHPQRSVASSWTAISAVIVALAAAGVGLAYVSASGVSFDRAAIAYAARFPDADTWWHIWGAGGPYLAAPSWPLLKLGAMSGLGQRAFPVLAAAIGALYGIAFLLLALRAGARRWALPLALAAILPPALWVWPRGGDVTSLCGLAAVVLALAGSRVRRMRFLAVAAAVAVGSFGGIAWVLAAAVVGTVAGIRDRRGRVGILGAVFGVLISTAITLPPFLSRGIDALRPPLARAPAVSDLVPVVASAALVGLVLASGRARRFALGVALVFAVASNALALAVPTDRPPAPLLPSTGAFGRLAVYPTQALTFAVQQPDLPTTGDDVSPALMLGTVSKDAMNTGLEWLGVDRVLPPDRSAAIVFNERDWTVLDRAKLLLAAPSVPPLRPVLSAAITNTVLVVADAPDAVTFGQALINAGIPSASLVPIRANKLLDELDPATLQQFTVLAVYGQPWRDRAKAQKVLDGFLQQSGFVFMDTAARAGLEPLLPEARTLAAGQASVVGPEPTLIAGGGGYGGRVVGIDSFTYANDPTWERAALVADGKRVIQFGRVQVQGSTDSFAHLVWSGVDLPGRAANGDPHAIAQLNDAFTWLLSAAAAAANLPQQPPFARATKGDTLDSDAFTATFISPTHWRIAMKQQVTGVLFKERYNDQWHAYQVDLMPLTHEETRTALPIWQTTQGLMYVNLTANARTIDFELQPHPLEVAARAVSAVALFAVLGISFLQWRRR